MKRWKRSSVGNSSNDVGNREVKGRKVRLGISKPNVKAFKAHPLKYEKTNNGKR